jgi:hypothetical protein
MADPLFKRKYRIVLADPPWPYYGDPNKNAAAGKWRNKSQYLIASGVDGYARAPDFARR